jgi:hypothetical protein
MNQIKLRTENKKAHINRSTKNLTSISNEDLHHKLKSLAERERNITLEILWHLREVEARRLYCEFGYGSLIDYCVGELKYSESSAYRRIQSMRLLKDLPELAAKIETGALTLSNLARTQSNIKQIEKQCGQKMAATAKKEILLKLENKSQRQAEVLLAEINPQSAPKKQERVLSAEKHLLQVAVSKKSYQALIEIEQLSGLPHDLERIFDLMIEKTLAQLKKQKGLTNKNSPTHNPKPHTSTAAVSQCDLNQRKYISIHDKRQIWMRAQHQCEFVDQATNRRCNQKRFLHIDHIKPISKMGSNHPTNLQLLCSAHNLWKGSR